MEKAIRQKWAQHSHRIRDTNWIWIIPSIGLVLDVFIFVIPADLIIALAIATAPQRWRPVLLACVIASTIGLMLLFFLMEIGAVEHYFANLASKIAWGNQEAATYFNQYGALSLLVVGFTPLPTQVPVMLSAMSGIPWWEVLACLVIGRIGRYSVLVAVIFTGRKAWIKLIPHTAPSGLKDDSKDSL